MNPQLFVDVDPRTLHLPTTRPTGADLYKLQRQIARFGASIERMPPPEVYRGKDGELLTTMVSRERPEQLNCCPVD